MRNVWVVVSPGQVAAALWLHGEDDLLDRALRLSDADLRRLWNLAGNYGLKPPVAMDARMLATHAVALAAVVILEGEVRPLARERRRPFKQMPPHLRDAEPMPPSTTV